MAFLMVVQVPIEPTAAADLILNKNQNENVDIESKGTTDGESTDRKDEGDQTEKETKKNINVEDIPIDSSEKEEISSSGADNTEEEKDDTVNAEPENDVMEKEAGGMAVTDNVQAVNESVDNKAESVAESVNNTEGKTGDGSAAEIKEEVVSETEVLDKNEDKSEEIKTDEGVVQGNSCNETKTEKEDTCSNILPGQLGAMTPTTLKNLVPLVAKVPLHQEVENLLTTEGKVKNLEKSVVGKGDFIKFSFIEEDSKQCETILNMLKVIGIGFTADTSISVFPSSLHESGKGDLESVTSEKSLDDLQGREETLQDAQKESVFKKSIKSRLVVAQVVSSVRNNATFTFDYLLLLLLASFIACVGLVESSSVVLVASMLISPLMGPILAGTFGQVVKMKDLRNLGIRSELVGLSLCLIVGFGFGLITGGIGLHGAVWGSSDQWPTPEMASRGMLRSLWVGMLIALPSGAGVAISVLSANAGSLVGVAISASLLPPACNAGMLWGYSLLAAISPPAVKTSSILTTTLPTTTESILQNVTMASNITFNTTNDPPMSPETDHSGPLVCPPLVNNAYIPVYSCNIAADAALLGLVSLALTILNIFFIFCVGIIFLKIKEVAPHTAGKERATDNFWHEDVRVARNYYETSKGVQSSKLGKQFLSEWKKIKHSMTGGDDNQHKDSLTEPAETVEMCHYLQKMQNSPDMQQLLSKLNTPTQDLMGDLSADFVAAKTKLEEEIVRHPGFVLSNTVMQTRDNKLMRAYHTLSVAAPETEKTSLFELRNRFRKMGQAKSMFLDIDIENEMGKTPPTLSEPVESSLGKRRRQKREKMVKFDVQRVDSEEEEQLLTIS